MENKMKKIILLLILLVILVLNSCSIGDGMWVKGIDNESKFSPPSWIIGTWSNELLYMSYEFTSNNIIYNYLGSNFDFSENFKNAIVDEVLISNYIYIIFIDVEGIIDTFRFTKYSDTMLSYEFNEQELALYKQ